MLNYIKKHILVETFINLRGNPKLSIITEPLWFIPFALFLPFQSLYMRELGLSNQEIGLTVTVGLFLQVFFSVFGGIVTDKMGRRKATFIFDTIGWSLPCLIWAFSQNFWWFLIASGFNAVYLITNTSWNCLFIEDCPPKYVGNAYMLIQIGGMLSVFFAPLSIWLVGLYGVVPVVRCLYVISAISMFIKFWILYRYGTETKMGVIRLEQTKNSSYWQMFKGYKGVFIKFIHSRKMIFMVVFLSILNIVNIPLNTFFSIYVTESLKLPDELIAVFPMIRTFILIAFVIGLQNAFSRFSMKKSIVIGLVIYIISHLVLILAPEYNLFLVLIYTILEAIAYAIIIPRKEELTALYVDREDRSRIYAIFSAATVAISAPFGYLIGGLFDRNGRLPFYFNICLFIILILLCVKSKDIKNHENDNLNYQ